MDWLTDIFNRIMGCVCSREYVAVGERRFYVQSRLGEGGFSYVDLVEDVRSHKQYALKRISCHSKEDEREALKEVEVMRMLDHRNLCPLEESGVHPINDPRLSVTSEVLIVMPFCRRGTLQDHIEMLSKTCEYMSEDRIVRVFRGVCLGLQAMHQHSPAYAHRDMKPANVLLTDSDDPLIMDFGSAAPARVHIKTSADARVLQDYAAEKCSMPFRPPELFQVETGVTLDERTDIWSLGCTLYAMVYLESPFEAVYNRGDSMALAVLGTIKYPISSRYSNGLIDLMRVMLTHHNQRPHIADIIHRTDVLLVNAENRI